ncbi:hypothetical protein WMY93_024058 [Mugilogobius chulae]|uniref:Uncharacterized protein n=1 Tax=Mugilogobius chulae TaxID=88201 RepID=A0AAW0NH53_9GOBI
MTMTGTSNHRPGGRLQSFSRKAIIDHGTSLPCKDETLCNEVDELLKSEEGCDAHCLGLDTYNIMEETLQSEMYSGKFTHCIKPVFSAKQIEVLFGLLGYRRCSSGREQLRLQAQKVSAARVDELLRLSCAFFVARCECGLLLAALGRYAGQPRWELNIVRERQRGHNLQIALDSTMRLVDVKQPLQELPEENDMDLYTDEPEGDIVRELPVDESLAL